MLVAVVVVFAVLWLPQRSDNQPNLLLVQRFHFQGVVTL